MALPKKNVAYTFSASLIDMVSGDFKANPTIAVGDFQVSTDESSFTNLATLPVVDPAGSINVKISLSASEMNGDRITVRCVDVAGDEWANAVFFINTTVVTIDDVVRATTPANTLNVTAGGLAETDVQQLGGSAAALSRLAALYEGAVASGTVNTVTSSGDFTLTSSDLLTTDSVYNNMWLVLLDSGNKFVPRLITVYTGATKRVQFTGTGLAGPYPLTVNPGDAWLLIAGSL